MPGAWRPGPGPWALDSGSAIRGLALLAAARISELRSQIAMPGRNPISRSDALVEVQKRFIARSYPRVHILLILALSGLAAFLFSAGTLRLGLDHMGVRYFAAMLAGYATFLLLIRAWIECQRYGVDPVDALDAADAASSTADAAGSVSPGAAVAAPEAERAGTQQPSRALPPRSDSTQAWTMRGRSLSQPFARSPGCWPLSMWFTLHRCCSPRSRSMPHSSRGCIDDYRESTRAIGLIRRCG